jgi:uridylate kinase
MLRYERVLIKLSGRAVAGIHESGFSAEGSTI